MRRHLRTLPLAAALALVATVAAATEFRSFERRDQVRASELIVRGRVVAVSAGWNAGRSAIVSDAEVAIDEVLKGRAAGDRVVVRTLGGTVGRVRLEVEGAARFAAGETVVLFLARRAGAYEPLGMRFGKYELIGGATPTAVGALPPAAGSRSPRESRLTLDELRSEIRAEERTPNR